MTFVSGTSGNPAGRPKTLHVASRDAQRTLARYGPLLIARAIESALAGDVTVLAPLLGLLRDQLAERRTSRRRMPPAIAVEPSPGDAIADASEPAAAHASSRLSDVPSPGGSTATDIAATEPHPVSPDASLAGSGPAANDAEGAPELAAILPGASRSSDGACAGSTKNTSAGASDASATRASPEPRGFSPVAGRPSNGCAPSGSTATISPAADPLPAPVSVPAAAPAPAWPPYHDDDLF